MAVVIHHKQPHKVAFGMNEDQGLLAALAAGLANDALPTRAQLLLDQPVQLFSVNWPRKVFELRQVQAVYAPMCCLPRDQAHNSEEGNPRGVNVILAFDRMYHAIKAFAAPSQHRDRNSNATSPMGIRNNRFIGRRPSYPGP